MSRPDPLSERLEFLGVLEAERKREQSGENPERGDAHVLNFWLPRLLALDPDYKKPTATQQGSISAKSSRPPGKPA